MSKKTGRKNRSAAAQSSRPGSAAVSPPPGSGGAERYTIEQTGGGSSVKRRALWSLAAILIVSGYALLHKADPGGQNVWAILSPALLLSGYLLIIPAITYTYRR